MSKLIKVPISDQQSKKSNYALTETNFYKQLGTPKYPAIYIDLGSTGPLTFNDGILTIGNNVYNMFSRHVIDIVQAIITNGGQAWLTSPNLALYPALFLENIQSSQIVNIELQKSPTVLSDFIPSIVNNLITIDPTHFTFTIKTIFDSNDDEISYSYNDSTHNLYVDILGTVLVECTASQFVMFARIDKLLSTKSLLKSPTITEFEKSLILDTLVDNSNMLYE